MVKIELDNYSKEVACFLNYMDGTISDAFNDQDNGNNKPMEELEKGGFKLSFNGASIDLWFEATSYDAIRDALVRIMEEWQ